MSELVNYTEEHTEEDLLRNVKNIILEIVYF